MHLYCLKWLSTARRFAWLINTVCPPLSAIFSSHYMFILCIPSPLLMVKREMRSNSIIAQRCPSDQLVSVPIAIWRVVFPVPSNVSA